MAKAQRKTQARLEARIALFNQRDSFAAQTPGGAKIAAMMNKPGSQNRNKR